MNGSFTWLDWVVLGGYLALVVVTGVVFARRKQKDTEDYFLGGHRMPVWAVAISLLATVQSAATFVGVPELSFAGDLTYLSTSIGGIIAAIIVGAVFIPAFYANRVATPYQLLEIRFGLAGKVVASMMYLVGRVFSSGARVYIAAIPAAMILFGDGMPLEQMSVEIAVGIAALMAVSIFYTIAGGIRSVIWTDVVQACVYLGATVIVIGVLLARIPIGAGAIVEALSTGGEGGASKLRVIDPGLRPGAARLGFDAGQQFTLLTALTGFVLLTIASHGTDQDNVQRMLTCRTKGRGVWSLMTGVLIGVPAVALFLIVGLLLAVFYRMPGVMGERAPEYAVDAKYVFITFILREVPMGVKGLMLAGLFAAGISSINSSLNAMSATFVSDVYRHVVRGRDERHYVRVGRLGVLGWGITLAAFAVLCVFWHRHQLARGAQVSLIDFALAVMGFAYAGLLGVFFTALFTRRGSAWSVVASLAVGFLVVLAFQPWAWEWIWSHASWTRATPHVEGDFRLGEFRIAYPWQLVIGTIASTAVCMLPRGRGTWPSASVIS